MQKTEKNQMKAVIAEKKNCLMKWGNSRKTNVIYEAKIETENTYICLIPNEIKQD